MCGIFGYVGNKTAYTEVYDGLKKLEYRGYDSCGISVIDKHKFKTIKELAAQKSLKANLNQKPLLVLVIPDGPHMVLLVLRMLIHI